MDKMTYKQFVQTVEQYMARNKFKIREDHEHYCGGVRCVVCPYHKPALPAEHRCMGLELRSYAHAKQMVKLEELYGEV
jgi:hypothetical protein